MKKAFTLIELSAVVAILGLITLIAVPTINDTIKKSKNKVYQQQIDLIKASSKNWVAKNTFTVDKYKMPFYLNIKTLSDDGFIDKEEIIDPRSKNYIKGCIKITYDSEYKQYEYVYNEVCQENILN